MIIKIFVSLLCLYATLSAAVDNEKLMKAKSQEIELLRTYLESARDSFELEITRRYALKQQLLEQREADKDEFDRLKELQERALNDLSQIKEEVLAKVQQIEDENITVKEKKDEWISVKESIDDLYRKTNENISESFPLDREKNLADFAAIQNRFTSTKDPATGWKNLVLYKMELLNSGSKTYTGVEKILPDDAAPTTVQSVRFGNVFSYGLDQNGTVFTIRQTGRLGKDRYAIEKILAAEITEKISIIIPGWISGGIAGVVPVDVMQNEQSRILISGKKVKWYEELWHSWMQGGAVMIPILLLPLWAVYLLLKKVVQIYGRKGQFARQFKNVMKHLDRSNYDSAIAYCKSQNGLMARVFEMCIERRGRERHGCEQVARELIFHEIPKISKNINTMAVIAGAAPLLGLLGTISGMITLFAAVTHYGTGDPKFLAGGISEALITAKTGLAIAIPALFFHDFLRSSKESLLAEIEHYTSHVLNKIWPEG